MDEFRFKILVLGTSDRLKAEFLSLISQRSWSVDGVSGHYYESETDKVSMDIWFPKENASSLILVSLSYSDVNGVIIVMGRKDRRTLRRFVKIINERIGDVPYVGVSLRRNMTDEEKALKSLHAVRILSEKMKERSIIGEEVQESDKSIPQAIPGKFTYKVDEFGFVFRDWIDGVPLFVDDSEDNTKPKKK